jgi:glutathione S-transferase
VGFTFPWAAVTPALNVLEDNFATGRNFALADCAPAPAIFFAVTMLPVLGAKSPLEGRPNLASWWNHVQTRPSVKRVLAEIAEALAAMQRGG